jgi:hypothetical protein
MKEQIKVGFCVAYDWYLLEYSIPLVYASADRIFISVDKDRISWNLKKYVFESNEFYALVRKLDPDNKITLIEEDYHQPDLTPAQNEVRQRNMLAGHMGTGGWHIQLDCDEYMVDFEGFTRYLLSFPVRKSKAVNICCPVVTLFKKVEGGMLYIAGAEKSSIEYFPVASRFPHYEYGRVNGYFNIYTNFKILHQSFARESKDLEAKLNNWGHVRDLDPQKYLGFWNNLSAENFRQFRNIHPIKPHVWPGLKFAGGETVNEMKVNFAGKDEFTRSVLDLALSNNKNFSRLKYLLRRLRLNGKN